MSADKADKVPILEREPPRWLPGLLLAVIFIWVARNDEGPFVERYWPGVAFIAIYPGTVIGGVYAYLLAKQAKVGLAATIALAVVGASYGPLLVAALHP